MSGLHSRSLNLAATIADMEKQHEQTIQDMQKVHKHIFISDGTQMMNSMKADFESKLYNTAQLTTQVALQQSERNILEQTVTDLRAKNAYLQVRFCCY